MLAEQRFEAILQELADNRAASVTRLCELTGASEATIRRDLTILSRQGRLNKVHGGATALHQEFVKLEDNIEEKLTKNTDKKTEIARYAAKQINDDDFVFLDAGTTTLLMAQFLNNSGATFVTNGIENAKQLAKNGCKTIVLGGQLKQSTEAIIGLVAASNLQKYSFTKAFIGTNGINEKQGYTTPDTEEAMLKAVAIKRSFISYVLADNSKFDKVSAVSFAQLDAACIITDKCANDKIKKRTVVKEVL